MQPVNNERGLSFLVGNQGVLDSANKTPVLPLFSELVTNFLDALSKEILSNKMYKKYSDVVAFAFWIRSASVENESLKYKGDNNRIGRGVVFHVAPSNIPVQFAVSMVYSLVAGNVSVVRVSNKSFEQVEVICSAINTVIARLDSDIKKYIVILRYEHNDDTTRYLSGMCDARLIWGGDNTIEVIKKIPIPPRSIDLSFANRYSIAVIDSDYLLESNLEWVVNDFYLDTYYSDQNACSSSRLVVWKGSHIDEAKEIFWKSLKKKVEDNYELPEIAGSEKLLKTILIASERSGVKLLRESNSIVRIECPCIFSGMEKFFGNCGFFLECDVEKIIELLPILNKECQTVTYLDNESFKEDLKSLVCTYGLRGIDRIVKMGHSMDLSFIWDGYDMPIALSRAISYI